MTDEIAVRPHSVVMHLCGLLACDPVFRVAPSGEVVELSMMTTMMVTNTDTGEVGEETAPMPVLGLGAKFVNAARFVQKGDEVLVEGAMRVADCAADQRGPTERFEVVLERSDDVLELVPPPLEALAEWERDQERGKIMTDEIPAWRDINSITLRGRLGHDPEIRATQSGEVVNLNVATDEKWKSKQTCVANVKTTWHRVVGFDAKFVDAARSLRKGDRVLVKGAIQTREWVDREGLRRNVVEVLMGRFDGVLELVPKDEPSGSSSTPPRQPAFYVPTGNAAGSDEPYPGVPIDDEIKF